MNTSSRYACLSGLSNADRFNNRFVCEDRFWEVYNSRCVSVSCEQKSNIDDIKNFYKLHPPFEISPTNQEKYDALINSMLTDSIREYSEIYPLLDEKRITANSNTLDIFKDIDPKFMSFVMFTSVNSALSDANRILSTARFGSGMPANYNSIIDFVSSSTDALFIFEEWFKTHVTMLIFNGHYVKVKNGYEYYVLYKKYRSEADLWDGDLLNFKKLFDINFLLGLYQSDVYTGETGIRSVSISGLAVTFNVPSSENVIDNLKNKKNELMNSIVDYYDCVEVF